ncbi:MAG: hypothetical protein ABEJ93_04650 [Candidatus Nanohalobium sp.]
MDKALELVIAASVLLLSAAIVMFLVTGKTGSIEGLVDNTQGNTSCTIMKANFQRACNCNPDTEEGETYTTTKSENIFDKASKQNCRWTQNDYTTDSEGGNSELTCEISCN